LHTSQEARHEFYATLSAVHYHLPAAGGRDRGLVRARRRGQKAIALLTTLLTFVVSLLLLPGWQNIAAMQYVEELPWFPPLNIRYALGVDGISLFLVLLTTLLMPIAVYFSNLYVSKRIGAYMALMLLLVSYLRSLGYLRKVVTEEHYHLMGKLLFAFTVFWAYIAFSQYFLIWYANITEETRFYLLRNTEGWRWVSIALVIGHFVVPFVFLLQQQLKKKPAFICFWGVWVLSMHVLDIYWNVIPERGPSLGIGVLAPGAWVGDVVALVTIFCLSGWYFLRSLNKYSLYPWRDPRLIESVNVVN